MGIPLAKVETSVEGDLDLRGFLGCGEGVRPGFQAIRGTVTLYSSAGEEQLKTLKGAVDGHCRDRCAVLPRRASRGGPLFLEISSTARRHRVLLRETHAPTGPMCIHRQRTIRLHISVFRLYMSLQRGWL